MRSLEDITFGDKVLTVLTVAIVIFVFAMEVK